MCKENKDKKNKRINYTQPMRKEKPHMLIMIIVDILTIIFFIADQIITIDMNIKKYIVLILITTMFSSLFWSLFKQDNIEDYD